MERRRATSRSLIVETIGTSYGSNPSAAIVQSASDVQCSRLLKTTCRTSPKLRDRLPPCPFPGVFLSRVLVA
ncbi:hypothetical protein E4T65_28755 [Pseudomonas fluorescens]|uniref:Uncharacterized protein n=1 Tax=Pseudomonas fluorescens TaxID=294 RepID=A0A4Y9TBZ4_PSEFL|nr:hypothetical protein EKG40_31585 [Pseudomonas moorei]TFW38950.1 hypothetical protein E4T65_28755 [Pseudomonas fluorescens]